MAIDKVVFDGVEKGLTPPTFRIYTWSPPCITIGYHQKADSEVNLTKARDHGIDVVNRITGGRAVFHIDEFTYSLCAPNDASAWCSQSGESYHTISTGIVRSLPFKGLSISLEKGYPVELPRTKGAMSPCFTSTSRSEVVWHGKKLVGSAQRRKKNSFLQHGAMLLSEQHLRLVDYLNLTCSEKSAYLSLLNSRAISLDKILGKAVTFEQASNGFLEAFGQELNVDYESSSLSRDEWQKAMELAEEP